MGRESKHINLSCLFSLIYLNVWFLLGVILVNQIYFKFHISIFESNPKPVYFFVRAFLFLIFPIVIGLLIDFLGRKRFFLLRKYALLIKLLLLLFCSILIYMFFYIDEGIVMAFVTLLFVALNVFYIPANLSLSNYWRSKWLPFVMALMAISIYPFFVFETYIALLFQFFGIGWSVAIIVFGIFHSGYVFRKHFKKQKYEEFLKGNVTTWSIVIWSAIILGLGNASLFSVYPKIYLMLNEPHGVSVGDALLFEKELFMWVLSLLIPVGLITVKIGAIKLIKINNTLMLLSVIATIIFPVYFFQLAIVTTVSLCFAVTVNLPVVFINLSEKQRGVGVGVFIGVSMFLSLLLTMLF